jgi:aspartyl-tRNA(Asn)/glutamyl-tRNA(Gln) amidotransferase subunit C
VALTADEVRHIARLARVGLTDEDVARFQTQLSSILDSFAALQAIDTDGVRPTAQPQDLLNVERDDDPRPSLPRQEMLANAPVRDGEFIRVRRILE